MHGAQKSPGYRWSGGKCGARVHDHADVLLDYRIDDDEAADHSDLRSAKLESRGMTMGPVLSCPVPSLLYHSDRSSRQRKEDINGRVKADRVRLNVKGKKKDVIQRD